MSDVEIVESNKYQLEFEIAARAGMRPVWAGPSPNRADRPKPKPAGQRALCFFLPSYKIHRRDRLRLPCFIPSQMRGGGLRPPWCLRVVVWGMSDGQYPYYYFFFVFFDPGLLGGGLRPHWCLSSSSFQRTLCAVRIRSLR